MSKSYLKVSTDFTDNFNEVVKRFKSDSVLVGIPEANGSRDDDAEIGNAAILAINVFGSPANNIPARDVMSTGLKNAQDKIAEQFKVCAQTALSKGPAALEVYYERAGMIGSNSIKKAINDQDWPSGDDNEGPREATLAIRKRNGFKGNKSLVVTGQLRNSITYVVRSIWGR